MDSPIIERPAERRMRKPTRIELLLVFLLVFTFGSGYAYGAAAAAPGYTDQCTRTAKSNGGEVIDCDPLAASPSPSASASASPSPSISPPPSPSPSPSPTPPPTTPPPGPQANCMGTVRSVVDQARLAQCGYPTTSSTGVPPGTALTLFNGDYYARTAGAVISGMDLNGCLYVVASNVTIQNTRVRMADRCFYGLSTYDVASGGLTTIRNVEVVCNYAHGSAIAGPGLRVSKVYVHGCENGFEVNGNSIIEDSYIVGSEQGSSTAHGDDMQSQGGNNVTIRHNTFAGLNPITSSIITNPTANNSWLIELNFLSAGAYTLYCPEQGTNFTVRNNRFFPPKLYPGDLRSAAYGLTDACAHAGISWSGNVYDDRPTVAVPA